MPSEAEWEKAARGLSPEYGDSMMAWDGDGTREWVEVGLGYRYPWGRVLDSSRTNFSRSGDPFESATTWATTPVGYYDGRIHDGYQTGVGTSACGIDDMAGNAAEWTADWEGPYRKPHQPPADGTRRIVRGGSWKSPGFDCRTTARASAPPDTLDPAIGFRTAGDGKDYAGWSSDH